MKNLLQSKLAAWIGLILVVVITVVAFPMFRQYWWAFSVMFFAFMSVFCQLASLYLGSFSASAGKKLRMCAFIMALLAVISFIAVFIAFQFLTE